jgi:hypothetical protein
VRRRNRLPSDGEVEPSNFRELRDFRISETDVVAWLWVPAECRPVLLQRDRDLLVTSVLDDDRVRGTVRDHECCVEDTFGAASPTRRQTLRK